MKPGITFIPAAERWGRVLMLFVVLVTGRALAQNTNLWAPKNPDGPSYEELETYGATNESFAPAIKFFLATLQGHQPSELPAGMTIEDIATAARMVFPGANIIMDKPIFFYGKLQDEKGEAVVRATIHFRWKGFITLGATKEDVESDSAGKFVLRNKSGQELDVSIDAPGYYAFKQNREKEHYNYAAPYREIFKPDPNQPVIYNFQKKGQGIELLTSDKGVRPNLALLVPTNGLPIRVDFFQKQISSSGQLEISQNKPPWRTATNWSFKISLPDGGLVENADEFQFEAPEVGYQPTIELRFTKGETNWTTSLARNYYIAFGSPRKYGWIHIESNLSQQTIFLTYAINADGSRNLEPK